MASIRDVLTNPDALYIIGEISCNHGNDLDIVLRTIDGLVEVGADAVKIQTDMLDGTGSTMDFRTPFFTVSGGTIWDGVNLMDLYKDAHTPLEWHKPIFDYCKERGIECFSTPYSDSTIEYLKNFDMPAIKVASMEASDLNFVRRCARFGVPIIISTGMVTYEQARRAVEVCREEGNNDIILLKCVSEYPAAPEAMQLSALGKFRKNLGVVPGLSDHSITHLSSIVSTAQGGQVIEKHVKLDDTIGGPDASFSLTVEQFGEMVTLCHQAKASLGQGLMSPKKPQVSYSRSIFVIKNVKAGDTITADNVRIIRPGHGMDPNDWNDVIGQTFTQDVAAGHPLLVEHVTR